MSTKIKTSDGWKDVAGAGDTYFVRKPAWSQAVAVTNAQLIAGYAAPADGIFILVGNAEALDTTVFCKVNNVIVGMSRRNMNYNDFIQCSVPVLENDIIQTTDAIELQSALFIPFEDSTVAEPEVVTPEYIRNQNILSDWESITMPSEGYVAPYDGIITVYTSAFTATSNFACIRVNSVACNSWGIIPNGTQIQANTLSNSTVVKKGDIVTVIGTTDNTRARWYKLRDYTGR